MKYRQLTLEKRYQISALKKLGMNQSYIAKEIGVHKSTVSRELSRNACSAYSAECAQVNARIRHKNKKRKIHLTQVVKVYIGQKLKEHWSPEQISGRLHIDMNVSISHETIYQYIYKNLRQGGTLYKHLRHQNKKYTKRSSQYKTRGQIKDRISIEERPSVVDTYSRIGDMEIDTVIGKSHRGAIVTIVDRKSKFSLFKKVESKHASPVTGALIDIMLPIKEYIHTLTADNGKEFSFHKDVSAALDCGFYFCHPYRSSERGLNENTNGLLRQYFPKGTDFSEITDKQIIQAQERLNHRPRKSLGYKTPFEVFFGTIAKDIAS
jgi:IS30 family transposase